MLISFIFVFLRDATHWIVLEVYQLCFDEDVSVTPYLHAGKTNSNTGLGILLLLNMAISGVRPVTKTLLLLPCALSGLILKIRAMPP